MNIFRVTVSLLAFSVTLAHGSYIPTDRDAPFNLLPRAQLPSLSSSSSIFLVASNTPPSPSTPPSPKLPNPLPAEQNGVLLNGTVINPNPGNNANATKSPQSCWTRPVKPAVPMKKGDFSRGQCQVCVTRWDTGADPMYQYWIRDAQNHAMGEMNATSLSFADNLAVPAGNKFFSLWEVEFPNTYGVWMSWEADTDDYFQGQMAFTPSSIGSESGETCTFSGSTDSGAVIYFQCQFDCHT